jgi:hypothetical protein
MNIGDSIKCLPIPLVVSAFYLAKMAIANWHFLKSYLGWQMARYIYISLPIATG